MLRRLYTAAWGTSLLLCLGTIAFWVRSYRVQDQPTYARKGRTSVQITSRSGLLWLDIVADWPGDCDAWVKGKPEENLGPFYCPSPGMCSSWERLGVKVLNGYFSVAVRQGQVLTLAPGPDQTPVIASADQWPVCRGFELSAPFGYYAATFGLLPLISLTSFARQHRLARQRRRLHLCPACGYDLRATAERCPECGSPINSKSEATA
jgi:hypothetical protein